MNFSAGQFKATANLESEIKRSLKRWRIPPSHIEVELTLLREGHIKPASMRPPKIVTTA